MSRNDITFLSKAGVFSGDCSCDLHNRTYEPTNCLHYHDFYELFVYQGNGGSFVFDGKEYEFNYGDIALVDMFVPHMLLPGSSQDNQCLVAHINPSLLISYSTPGANLPDIFKKGSSSSPVYHIGERGFGKYSYLMDEYRSLHMYGHQEILIKAIIHKLLAYAYNDCFSGIRCNDDTSRSLTVVTRLINYVNAHLVEKISLSDLAKEVNYSESYICHLFKEATGFTLTGYIQEKRIEKAASLLGNAVPISKVSEQAGFNNYRHFYKTFKKQMGISPAEYKERMEASLVNLQEDRSSSIRHQ